MKLSELARGVRERLREALSEAAANGEASMGTEAQYSSDIAEVRCERGISCRRSCTVCFDMRYSNGADGETTLADWAEIMSREFADIPADGTILHTSKKSFRSEDGFYHFTFEVRADYIECESAETMMSLEITGSGK